MFVLLLVTTLGSALLTSAIVLQFFNKPIRQILQEPLPAFGDALADDPIEGNAK